MILHASPLIGDTPGIGIIVEGARPVTLSEVIAGAYGLTRREREVTGLAAQGRSTKQIALTLGISPFTVQDHLKAVFAKVGVRSRAELVATLYVQHYEPRRGNGSHPQPLRLVPRRLHHRRLSAAPRRSPLEIPRRACGCRILVRGGDLGFCWSWFGAARIGGWPASTVLSGW